MKQFTYTESNIRASDPYDDVRDTNKTFAVYPVYTITPDNQRLLVEANDPQPRAYAMPDNDPAYATPDNDPAYATPDSQRVMVEANDPHVYETPDNDPAYYVIPNYQRVLVKANDPHAYATPDNDPAYATPDNQSVMVEANDHVYINAR